MAHPGLESADINAMAQVLSGKRVPEFMQKEMPAVWPLRAAISVAGEALSAVEFRSFGDAFYDLGWLQTSPTVASVRPASEAAAAMSTQNETVPATVFVVEGFVKASAVEKPPPPPA